MHRATLLCCQCTDPGSLLTLVLKSCETQHVADPEIHSYQDHPPSVDKPWAIRTSRGHRSWMTHLPLSRPREPVTAM